ncbi:MAG: site-specific integrase [Desulfuromonadaceae bacterium]
MKTRGKLPKGIYYPKGTSVLYIRFTNEFGKQTHESTKADDLDAAKLLLEHRKSEVLARRSPAIAAILGKVKAKQKTFSDFLKNDYYPSVASTPSEKTRKYTLDAFALKNGHFLVGDISLVHLLEYRNNQKIVESRVNDGSKINTNEILSKNQRHILKTVPASNATKNRHRAWLLHALSYAVSNSLFSKQTYKSITEDENYQKLPEVTKKPRAFSVEQLHKLLDAAENRNKELYQIIRLAIASGIRKGNLLRFEWGWINHDLNEIIVPPKNPKSKTWQNIPISEPIRTVIEERKLVKKGGCPYLFYNPETGTCWNNLNRSWWRILEEAGLRNRTDSQSLRILENKNKKRVEQGLDPLPLPEKVELGIDAVFHSLRHSFGSHLAYKRIPTITCMKLLGHSSLEMTENYLKELSGVQEYKRDLDSIAPLLQHHPIDKPEPYTDAQGRYIDEDGGIWVGEEDETEW